MMLELRPLLKDDVTEKYRGWLNDPEVNKYLSTRHKNVSLQEVVDFVEYCAEIKRYHWGIFVEGTHVGNVSCSAWNNHNRSIDISYLIGDRDFWGKGLATKAVGGAVEYLIVNKKFHRVSAGAEVDNVKSIQVMENLRFKRDATMREASYDEVTGRFRDVVVYSVLEQEWMELRPKYNWLKDTKVFPMRWEN